ncbi:WD40 repeat domain-containing protein [Streptomyces sp. YS415]|uniref:WD40 repeat domain-containing protein n=1 Tax=Streptomyces sp. YS415 TaxID=2944806 RepID=UPI00202285D0|nr:WD40 repeat domain-containing protein [Streptomyces sp. YS415]MCL7423930.1 WD40 repeat domain-containing protein [Streptomyces sp. YS415]
MNVEELVRDALRETAAEQPPAGPGWAERVLAVRRRRRTRRITAAAAATVTVVALAVAVPQLDSRREDVRPAGLLDGGHTTSAHPDQSPPRDLIAAGQAVLAAYYTTEIEKRTTETGIARRTYWLLDPGTGRYEKDTRWSFVAVAPGLRTAAVLERTLPARRIGLLDLATGEVERWIPVRQGVGGLAYSYDGTKLLATTYDGHPDAREKSYSTEGDVAWREPFGETPRTGFVVLDPAQGTAGPWRRLSTEGQDVNVRSDLQFSRSGRLVQARIIGGRDGMQTFYDLTGAAVAAPADERHLRSDVPARLSPDGTLAALGLTKEVPDRSYSSIRDPRTGKEIAKVRGAELLAWVDERRLIAWERSAGTEAYEPRLALVTIGSDEVRWLSGPRTQGDTFQWSWEPVFARP